MGNLPLSAHTQLISFWFSSLGWIFVMVSIGLVDWRIWEVSDLTVISSGLAWIGIWRVCFYTHAPILSSNQIMVCQKFAFLDSFTPGEITSAQVLMPLALILGLIGNASVVYGLRNVYFGLGHSTDVFCVGGVLFILTGVCSLLPVGWNLSSVLQNKTISFPDRFLMPMAPLSQSSGSGIFLGIFGSVLCVCSGLVYILYRVPVLILDPRVKPFGGKRPSNGLDKLR